MNTEQIYYSLMATNSNGSISGLFVAPLGLENLVLKL